MVNKKGSKYQFATTKDNYEDYSSGRVLYGVPGATGFPVRLVSEVFQRAKEILENEGVKPPYTIYDPFCGAGYSLTVIGFLQGKSIKNIIASDINKEILGTANKNLSLLTLKGFSNRVKELTHLKNTYSKPSHDEALESTKRLEKKIPNIEPKVFEFNILGNKNLPIPKASVDLVLTDLPYGKLTHWEGKNANIDPTLNFLNNIAPILKRTSLVVVSVNKKQKLSFEGYRRVKILKIGKRQVVFLVKQ